MAQFIKQFDSINQFYRYICDTPINEAFRYKWYISATTELSDWSGTNSFDQALELLKNGWSDMSQTLTRKLNVASKDIQPIKTSKNVLSVCGYQPVVALYLAGVPQNMVDKRMVAKKQKVIELTKDVTYSCSTTTEEIVNQSVKAMVVVKKLEAQGYRIKLNVALGVEKYGREIICKVCIKQPSDRLQVSKLAFPMVHPSMLRRLFLRYIEVNPDVTSAFTKNYGVPVGGCRLKSAFPNDTILPNVFEMDVNQVNCVDDLVRIAR